MDELLFKAMDIRQEVQNVWDKVKDRACNGMTDSERRAYDYGVTQTLGILQGLLELDEEPTVHVSGLNEITEMDIEALESIFLK